MLSLGALSYYVIAYDHVAGQAMCRSSSNCSNRVQSSSHHLHPGTHVSEAILGLQTPPLPQLLPRHFILMPPRIEGQPSQAWLEFLTPEIMI